MHPAWEMGVTSAPCQDCARESPLHPREHPKDSDWLRARPVGAAEAAQHPALTRASIPILGRYFHCQLPTDRKMERGGGEREAYDTII